MGTTPARPAGRYGEDQPTWYRAAARAGVVALAVLGVTWVVWTGLSRGSQPVSWTLVTYSVTNSSTVDVAFDVTAKPGVAARCTIVARSLRHVVVGTTTVDVPASDGASRRVNASVRTAEPAASAEVTQCDRA